MPSCWPVNMAWPIPCGGRGFGLTALARPPSRSQSGLRPRRRRGAAPCAICTHLSCTEAVEDYTGTLPAEMRRQASPRTHITLLRTTCVCSPILLAARTSGTTGSLRYFRPRRTATISSRWAAGHGTRLALGIGPFPSAPSPPLNLSTHAQGVEAGRRCRAGMTCLDCGACVGPFIAASGYLILLGRHLAAEIVRARTLGLCSG